jgi:hypothetical protein
LTKVVSLSVARAKRDEQVRSDIGFELATRPGVVEIGLRSPDGQITKAFLTPEQAKNLAGDIIAAALDAEDDS